MSDYDPTNIGEQERVDDDKNVKRKLARDSEKDDIKWLMGSKRGRRIIWRLLESAGVFSSTFNTNAMTMAYAEGFRGYGNKTLAIILKHCPEQFTVMMQEANNERRHHSDDGSSHNDH